jgi:hypothetical protein
VLSSLFTYPQQLLKATQSSMNPNYESDINIIDIDNPEFESSVPFVSAEQDAYCLAKASSDQRNESYGS